jgi:hypothetical protein
MVYLSTNAKMLIISVISIFTILLVLVIAYYNGLLYKDIRESNNSRNNKEVIVVENKKNDGIKLPVDTRISSVMSMPTRGFAGSFQQIGIVVNDDKSKILPLFGRQLYSNNSKWNYYIKNDAFHSESIPVEVNNRDCSDEVGCTELYSGDVLDVRILGERFTVEIYKTNNNIYNPFA